MNTADTNQPFPPDATILKILQGQNRPMRIDAILSVLKMRRSEKSALEASLERLDKKGFITRQKGGLWKAFSQPQARFAGTFRRLPDGAIIMPEDGSETALIDARLADDVWDGDLVRATRLPGRRAKINRVIERAQKLVPARVVRRQGKKIICRAIHKKPAIFFQITPGRADAARRGVLLLAQPEREIEPGLWKASLAQILPDEDDIKTQEKIVKTGHLVPGVFPDLALEQAASLPAAPTKADLAGREDMRHIGFVTIDGEDARDYDDAIHVEKRPDGWLLRVAIADVSHYVPHDASAGSLDAEARKRGNSWYFPTSVEPMLPTALSNGLCSLNPGQDRLAVLAEMLVSHSGHVEKTRFAPIVMRSCARLTYEQAGSYFANGDAPDIAPGVKAMLNDAHSLYSALAQARHERGALDFELREAAWSFDDQGRLLEITTTQRNDAHRLIEEFMIAANEAVARHLGDKGLAFPSRSHPAPDPEKIQSLFSALRSCAPEILPSGLKPADLQNPKALQAVLERARGAACEFAVNRLCLRHMAQARYQAENAGHFGLASKAYCHFTSPIRRYADLLTHRALKASSSQGADNGAPDRAELDHICGQLNLREREAVECEREMARRLACIELKERLGETITGTISGVTDFGVFLEFDHMPAEGIIRLSDLGDDYYEFDAANMRLVGRRSGQILRLGQRMQAKISAIDSERLEARLTPLGVGARRPAGVRRRTHARKERGQRAPGKRRERRR